MEKKQYIQPQMQVMDIDIRHFMLAVSSRSIDEGDGYGSMKGDGDGCFFGE
ncbi:MAG: hypothetical protein ACI4BA_02915 [Prevotella sp.]